MAKATGQRKSTVTLAEPQCQSPDQVGETETMVTEGGDGHKAALAPAYRDYLEARKALALAFKDREYRDQEAYRDGERRYRLYAEAIDRALKAREKGELDASDEYKGTVDKAIDRAAQLYREKTKQAMAECRQTIMEVWKASREAADEPTAFCEEAVEKAMRAREKSELDALSVYRLEIDRAIDRASQEYKDKLGWALVDCRQKVSEAWHSSMETSAHMTGIFEEDRSTSTEEASAERRPVHAGPRLGLRLRDKALWAKTRFNSAVNRAMRATRIGRRPG